MHSRSHLGIGFELWSNQRVWFWSVVNPHGNSGTIGAATTEAEAVREACTAIEELSALHRRRSASAVHARQRHRSVASPRSNSIILAASGWQGLVSNFRRYSTSFFAAHGGEVITVGSIGIA
jgi:hypothetical protein